MKKTLLFVFALMTLVQSCSIDDEGEMHVSGGFWFFLLALFLIVVAAVKSGNKDRKIIEEKLNKDGRKDSDFISSGSATYVGGHPDMDQNFSDVHFLVENDNIKFYHKPALKYPVLKFSIENARIQAINVEDATSIEKKLTVGRIFLVGIFAFAWKKKKKNELAFVTIEWNDGRFNHTTIFNFEGRDAMVRSNTFRNKLINAIK